MMRYRSNLSVAVLGIFVLSAHFAQAAEPLWNEYLQMRFIVPEGFIEGSQEELEKLAQKTPETKIHYSFSRLTPKPARTATIITIIGLGGTIGKTLPKNLTGPSDLPLQMSSSIWKSHTISVGQANTTVHGTPVITYSAFVPIKREAVIVTVAGVGQSESDVNALMQTLLSGLEAPTNWTPNAPLAKLSAPSNQAAEDDAIRNLVHSALNLLTYLGIGIGVTYFTIRSRKKKEKEKAQIEFRQKMAEDEPFE